MQVRRWLLVVGLVLGSGALAACGGDDDDASDEGSEPTDEGGGQSPADGADVPDACDAFDTADLSTAFGDVGTGTPRSMVDSRTVCTYENGVIVGVSEGNQYDGTIATASGVADCEEVSGLGDEASFCTTGDAVGQLFWLDGDLMFDVTAATTDKGDFEELAAKVKV